MTEVDGTVSENGSQPSMSASLVVSFLIAAVLAKKRLVSDDHDIEQLYGPEPAPTRPDRLA